MFITSVKHALSVALLDLYFIRVPNIFLRAGIAILSLLEDQLLSFNAESILVRFKPCVAALDPYQVIHTVLSNLVETHDLVYSTHHSSSLASCASLFLWRSAKKRLWDKPRNGHRCRHVVNEVMSELITLASSASSYNLPSSPLSSQVMHCLRTGNVTALQTLWETIHQAQPGSTAHVSTIESLASIPDTAYHAWANEVDYFQTR